MASKATESSQREKRSKPKKQSTGKEFSHLFFSPNARVDPRGVGRGPTAKDLEETPELPMHFYRRAGSLLSQRNPGAKALFTLRLDKDILKWLRGKGPGYQTRLNLALRTMMLADQKEQARKKRSA
jgi:uncharacterized protein (DUF4415 family)